MKRYKSKFKESIYPSRYDDVIILDEIESIHDLGKVIAKLVFDRADTFVQKEDIKFESPKTTFGKIPLAGSSLFSISFKEEEHTQSYGTYNIYTPTGLLNSHLGAVRWIEFTYPAEGITLTIEVKFK